MSRTNKQNTGKGTWREVVGPYGLQIRVSGDGDLEIRGRIRSGAELETMMGKLKAAVRAEYDFQTAHESARPAREVNSDAEQIALFDRESADWSGIPVLGASAGASDSTGPSLMGQSPAGKGRVAKRAGAQEDRRTERMSA